MQGTLLQCMSDRGAIWFNPDNPTPRHSRAGGNPAGYTLRKADKTSILTHCAGIFLNNWIPACAGMTRFRSNEQSGFDDMFT